MILTISATLFDFVLVVSDHTFVLKQSVELTVRCQTNSALQEPLKEGIDCQLTKIFKPVELEIRKLNGMENVKLDVQITENEFGRCTRNIGTSRPQKKESMIPVSYLI